jgi:hypothetical protein
MIDPQGQCSALRVCNAEMHHLNLDYHKIMPLTSKIQAGTTINDLNSIIQKMQTITEEFGISVAAATCSART